MADYTIDQRQNRLITDNRTLEQFLFVHELRFVHQYRNLDGRQTWIYNISEYLMEIVNEYYEVQRKRYEMQVEYHANI